MPAPTPGARRAHLANDTGMSGTRTTCNLNGASPAFPDLEKAVADGRDPMDVFAAAEKAAQAAIGHRLFTIMAFHADSVEVERLYSSNEGAYPPGGRKQKRDTAWGRQVLDQGEPFIGRSAEDIRAHFNDHELIIGLGLEAVLNMPIRHGGRTLGTVNLLHRADYYTEDHLAPAAEIARLVGCALSGNREKE